MTVLLDLELTCPVCFRAFSSQAVFPTGLTARTRTDLHEQVPGVQPLPYLVHTCMTCGYSGNDRDFGDRVHVARTIATNVWDELAPKLAAGAISGSEKYEFAAKVAMWRGAAPERIGELLLAAAWCCVDEGDIEAERYFRRKAAWMFEAALASWDGVAPGMRALLTYLVAELWRRVGDLEAATEWFDRVPSEVVAPVSQRWIIRAARQQRNDPREWFNGDPRNPDSYPSFAVGRPGHRRDAGLLRLIRRVAGLARRAVAAVVGGGRPPVRLSINRTAADRSRSRW
jgi:uncharacterized protein